MLESKIKDLCEALRRTGKETQAGYFESLLKRINSSSDKADQAEALQQLISCGKISDVANFTAEEDKFLGLVFEEAGKLIK